MKDEPEIWAAIAGIIIALALMVTLWSLVIWAMS